MRTSVEADVSAVVKLYENLAVLMPETHFSVENRISSRARKYMRFVNFLVQFGNTDKSGFIIFPKRLAMEFVGDGDRNDTYLVNRVLDELRQITFVWRTKIPDGKGGEDDLELKGNPMTFSLTTNKRGYAGIKFDRDFLEVMRDPNRPLIEVLFSYGFLLAETDFAYEHVLLFSKLWGQEATEKNALEELVATLELNVYRKAIGAEGLYPAVDNLTRYATKPSMKAVNSRTRFDVAYQLETRGESPVGKTRRKATHITFTIKLKRAYQLEMVFDGAFDINRLESLDGHLRDVVDFDNLLTLSEPKQATLPQIPAKLSGYTEDNAELFAVTEKMLVLGVPEIDITTALQRWKVEGVMETWDAFDKQRNNEKAGKINNPKAYLISLLKSGKGRKTPDERRKRQEAKARALNAKNRRESDARIEAEKTSLEERHRQHRHARTQELIAKLTPAELAEVVEAVSENIPLRPAAKAWEKIGRDPRRVGELGRSYFAVVGTKLAEVVLARWGEPADTDIEAFRQSETETA